MKIMICGAIVVLCGFVGLVIKESFGKRVQFYVCVIQFIDSFSINVNFLQKDLFSFINLEEYKSKEFVEMLKLLKSNFINGSADLNIKNSILKEAELQEVVNMFLDIGKTDVENQLSLLKGYRHTFEDKLKSAKQLDCKYSPLALKMSLLVGCLISLILI